MCGIAGWIDWERDLTEHRSSIEQMARVMTHRGPDGDGVWVSAKAAFAHRRLIDPEGGAQPMVRQLGQRRYVITYNGELYNTAELREELESRDHQFFTRSDTEVLLVSYVEWGPACLGRLNGIFAFAVWEEHDQRLFMARDRLGVKPLFYAQRGEALVFGSELKSLLACPLIEPVVDGEGLAEVFALGPARTPGYGVFRGVRELKPGHYLIHAREGTREKPYWTLESFIHTDSLEETVIRIRELFTDAVKRQLVSDVPVCTLLSGGLDSSAISAVTAQVFAQEGKGTLNTYSVDYEGNDKSFSPNSFEPDSDAPWARRVADYLNTRHHSVLIDNAELFESLKVAMVARDLPGMADIDGSLYLLCREIKKGATVALSGECADEVFGGYPWFHREEAVYANTFPWSRFVRERARLLSSDLVSWIQPEKYVLERYHEALSEVPRLRGEDPHETRIRGLFYLNLTRWMPTLLDRKDRMSMAAGLEVRVPFCDHRLVEYVWNVPWSFKTVDGQAKGILRRALRGILPDDVLDRRKNPYPKTHNPEYTRLVVRKMQVVLDDPSSPILPLINVNYIRDVIRSNFEGIDIPWFGQLMRGPQLIAYLIQVNEWLRHYGVSFS